MTIPNIVRFRTTTNPVKHGIMVCLILLQCQITFAQQGIGTRVVDIVGNRIQIGMDGSVLKPAVITFLNAECDAVDEVSKKLNQISKKAERQGLVFYGVFTGPKTAWKTVSEYASQNRFSFPVIVDGDENLTRLLKPKTVPEVFILGKHGQTLYQGGLNDIDNGMVAAQRNKAFSSNKETDEKCPLPPFDNPIETPAYHQHIAGLIQANCVECHRQNGIAPFHLEDYVQTRNFAPMIAYVTKERIMPPFYSAFWHC
ncbi:MAG: redoxin domain-containing protein [Gammaproteobacteria bacterium]|nr:redoxin domain-containing protein [Gammaproteobacteria bacterium]